MPKINSAKFLRIICDKTNDARKVEVHKEIFVNIDGSTSICNKFISTFQVDSRENDTGQCTNEVSFVPEPDPQMKMITANNYLQSMQFESDLLDLLNTNTSIKNQEILKDDEVMLLSDKSNEKKRRKTN